ncbi:Hok/Gef family protein [Kluyvera sichuanensis]|uniref:Hok/Gef family protein n=1 Tax=Kluyvera sichuanensis TaxID=2725494 RepID=UPI0039F5277C
MPPSCNSNYLGYSLIVICLTILLFTWMIRNSLCELHIKQGNNELAASLACDIRQ